MLMGSAPMQMQVLGAGAFDFLLTTAELARRLLSAGMICLNVLILIESICLGICSYSLTHGSCKIVVNHAPVMRPDKSLFIRKEFALVKLCELTVL